MEDLNKAYGIDVENELINTLAKHITIEFTKISLRLGSEDFVTGNLRAYEFEFEINLKDFENCSPGTVSFHGNQVIGSLRNLIHYKMLKIRKDHCNE